MSEVSILQALSENEPWRRRKLKSISGLTRRIVYLCLAFLIVICVAAISSMRTQSIMVDKLVLTLDPMVDSNHSIFREMTVAKVELFPYQISRNPNLLASFRDTRAQIEEKLMHLLNDVADLADHSSSAVDSKLMSLELIQRESAMRWLDYSLLIAQNSIQGDFLISSTEVVLFNGFQRANDEFDNLLGSLAGQARIRARTASNRGITVMIIAALLSSIVMSFLGLRLARAITKPIIGLNDTMKRQREGDISARAEEDHDSLETMTMAHEFNVLIERQIGYQQMQERALHMHELAAKIEQEVRLASNTQQSLEIICNALGEGIGVDRVMANILDSDQRRSLVAQWHLPDLPPLGNLPDDIVPDLGEVAKELWHASGRLVSNDRLAPEAQTERVRMFYRYTGARAVIVVPIGLGDRAIGMIYVVTVNRSRQWAESEINVVQRAADFLAYSIVEDTYRTQQNEHIELLTRLDRQKANFVATVSHELRTPLTSIIGYLEVLKDGYAGELIGEQSRLIEVIDRNASRLLGLLNDLLTLTQSENGGLTDDLTDVSISELIIESCQELPPIVHSDAVKLEIDAGPKSAIVRGDRGQLKSVIVNIVSNAIKFSRSGGVVKICCTLVKETNRIRIIVEDRGIGIPTVDQEELFSRFYRASNATAKFIPGTGLGLSIVKQIINDHGGEVRLNSVEDEGTTVTVDLPLALTEVAHNPK